jgi:2-keto-4-pentenoate hydratase/2-oxohepta-3-ene-1,7-dioic acid hydratase in catechol pathway
MKLARFTVEGVTKIGKVVDGAVVDLSALAGVTSSMRQVIADLDALRPSLQAASGPVYPLSGVRLEAPITDPQKFLAIGLNYKSHVDESAAGGVKAPSSQLWFNKQVSCITGPFDPIERPSVSEELDYEGELAFVIGTKCRHVARAHALSVIAGYMICNDVSVRDWQHRTPTFTLGKSFDTHGPTGPWITTSDEVAAPEALNLRLLVNGELRQEASTGQMIYKIADQIAYLTTVMTLYPGDVIATGTPAGVAASTRNWLKPGDIVRAEIEGLGHIENKVVDAAS